MTLRFIKIMCIFVLGFVRGCKTRESSESSLNQIVGQNDMVRVSNNLENLPESFRPFVGAIGRMHLDGNKQIFFRS